MKSIHAWVLMNFPLAILISVAFMMGVIQPFFHDAAHITHMIFGAFALSVIHTGWIAREISRMDTGKIAREWRAETSHVSTSDAREVIFIHLSSYLRVPRFMVKFLVGLGFFGTIVGVVVGFQDIPTDMFADAAQMQAFIKQILSGFAIELHSLLMGLVTSMWLSVVILLLETYLERVYRGVLVHEG